MTSIIHAPGVITREFGISSLGGAAGTTPVGLVTTATRGPMNTLTLIESIGQLTSTFGRVKLSPLTYGILAGNEYLQEGSVLHVVRVGDGTEEYAEVILTGSDSLPTNSLRVRAFTRGTWANGGDLQVRIQASTQPGGYRLDVYYEGTLVESFDNLTNGATSAATLLTNAETSINANSSYITVSVLSASIDPAIAATLYSPSGGIDGDASLVVANFIGTVSGSTRTGLQMFMPLDTVDVDILIIPGAHALLADSSTYDSLVDGLLESAAERGDCLALIEPPFGLSVDEVVAWHNGQVVSGVRSTARDRFDNSYGALYWSWLYTFEADNETNLWMSPSGFIAGVFAYSDRNGAPWFAAAGPARGIIPTATDVEYSPTDSERIVLSTGLNAVNPILNTTAYGIVVWGNKTLSRVSTLLQYVHVRRLVNYIKRALRNTLGYLTFNPNDASARSNLISMVLPLLENIRDSQGLHNFDIVCDDSNNTAETIARGELHGRVVLRPIEAAEQILVDFVLTSSSSVFTEA